MTTPSGDIPHHRDTMVLFDIDGTLTASRQNIDAHVDQVIQNLKKQYTVGLVGGSDLTKIADQTLPPSLRGLPGIDAIEVCVNRFDYVFAENGLVAYRDGELLAKQSIIQHLGEDKLQQFINFCLRYMSSLKLPVKRGNFVEFRNGLINICPVGRSCSQQEREQFNAYDKQHSVRIKFIEELMKQFGKDSDNPMDLTYSIGGQISFDVFPSGWDKTFCLKLIDKRHEIIHFFGDRTHPGGNDYEICSDSRTIGHTVQNPDATIKQLAALFGLN